MYHQEVLVISWWEVQCEVRQPLDHPASVADDHAQPPHAPQITFDRLPNSYQQPMEQSQIDDGVRFAKTALEGIQQGQKTYDLGSIRTTKNYLDTPDADTTMAAKKPTNWKLWSKVILGYGTFSLLIKSATTEIQGY